MNKKIIMTNLKNWNEKKIKKKHIKTIIKTKKSK